MPNYVFSGLLLIAIFILLFYIARTYFINHEKLIINEKEIPVEKPEREENEAISSYLKDKEFVNKNVQHLDDFIFNPELNHYDLEKLALLNNIPIDIGKGWYDLALELMLKLYALGWQGKVTCIKEKYAELKFYAKLPEKDKGSKEIFMAYFNLQEVYSEKSSNICEICGQAGGLIGEEWLKTRCEKHA